MSGVANLLTSRRVGVSLIRYAGLILAYLVLAEISFTVVFVHETILPIWPAVGLATGALALWGLRLWSAFFLAAFVAHYLLADIPVIISIGKSTASTLNAVLGAIALRQLGVLGEVARIRDALVMVLVATLAPLPAASIGALSYTLSGVAPWSKYTVLWLIWWVGASSGTLLVMPLLLAWAGKRAPSTMPTRPLELAGALLLVLAALGGARLYSTSLAQLGVSPLPITTFLSVPLGWAVLRLRPREAITVMALAASLAVAWTLALAPGQPLAALVWLQAILCSMCGVCLLLVGAITERAAARAAEQARAVAEVARKEAERASIEKSRFLAAVRHDLAQPLQAARLFLTALTQSCADTRSQTVVGHLAGSLEAMEGYLDGLKDITTIESGAVRSEIVVFALDELLDQLAEEHRMQAQQKGLRFRYARCTMRVKTDRQLLARILRNFLSNAVRYTTEGRILLGCRRTPCGVRIEVWDTGPGIPLSEQEAIFRPFHRASAASQSCADGGLGLGLATVQRLTSLLDLKLAVRSTVGKGSGFSVVIPTE